MRRVDTKGCSSTLGASMWRGWGGIEFGACWQWRDGTVTLALVGGSPGSWESRPKAALVPLPAHLRKAQGSGAAWSLVGSET